MNKIFWEKGPRKNGENFVKFQKHLNWFCWDNSCVRLCHCCATEVPQYPLDGGRVRSATSQNLLTDSRILKYTERKDAFRFSAYRKRKRGMKGRKERERQTGERKGGRENRAFGDALCSHLHFLRISMQLAWWMHERNRMLVSCPKIHSDDNT